MGDVDVETFPTVLIADGGAAVVSGRGASLKLSCWAACCKAAGRSDARSRCAGAGAIRAHRREQGALTRHCRCVLLELH